MYKIAVVHDQVNIMHHAVKHENHRKLQVYLQKAVFYFPEGY